ncbi:MAG: phosphatase PAP2 family protein, partial [Gaiellales bacterium]
MDYSIEHAINQFVHQHAFLVSLTELLTAWIVPIVFIAAAVPWLISGAGVDRGKRATTGAYFAALLGLGINQIVIRLIDRPRPFEAHGDIVPVGHASTDSSFPSDHSTAAFAIATAAWIAYPRAGKWL